MGSTLADATDEQIADEYRKREERRERREDLYEALNDHFVSNTYGSLDEWVAEVTRARAAVYANNRP